MTSLEPVLDGPALGLLLDLEHDGFSVELGDDGVLRIRPRDRLSPDRLAEILRHKDALRVLVRSVDAGVEARVEVFKAQLATTPAPAMPAFLFKPNVPYIRGICFACGERLPHLKFGRCWRCSVAWRLAACIRLDVELVRGRDEAKTIA